MPAAAGAQSGLTVDPHTPAGVEYAVPLDSARGHGGGGSGHPGGRSGGSNSSSAADGSGSPALFGSGITPPAQSGSGRGRHTGARGRQAAARKSPAEGSGSPRPVVTPVTASASYSSTGPLAGVIGGVLFIGGGLGVFLRLRARRPPLS
jgi:hypothetical protein